MNRRRLEARTEIVMGEEFTYFVTVFEEPLPETDDTNPYAPLGRCRGDVDTHARVAGAPAAPVAKCVPTKPQFIACFARAGALPQCVLSRRRYVVKGMVSVALHFRGATGGMPLRFARVMGEIRSLGIAGAYDAGRLGRLKHYFEDHARRRAAFEARALAAWAVDHEDRSV